MHLFSRLSIHQSTCWLLRPWSFGLLGLETRNTEIVRKLTPPKNDRRGMWNDCHSIDDGHQPEIYFATSAFCTQLAYYLDVSWFRPWISNLAWSDKTEKPRLFRCLEWHWLPFYWRLKIISYVYTHSCLPSSLEGFSSEGFCSVWYDRIWAMLGMSLIPIRSFPSYSTGKTDS